MTKYVVAGTPHRQKAYIEVEASTWEEALELAVAQFEEENIGYTLEDQEVYRYADERTVVREW